MRYAMAQRAHRGFTLIELMIVVAIIGILASFAIPAYQDYLTKSQVTEALYLTQAAKQPFVDYYANLGVWPTTASDAIGTTAGKYVSAITVTAGAGETVFSMTLTARMKDTGISPDLHGKTMTMSTEDGGKAWVCTAGTMSTRYLPSSCR